jgi:3-dehydroquinate dehydratase/shikimate dehydrogenase
MTLLAVPIMVESLDQALTAAQLAAQRGADLIEFRIDRFTHQPDALPTLIERSALPCILTCRPTWEGGYYAGDEPTRIALFEAAARGPRKPAYLDLELVAYEQSADWRSAIHRIIPTPATDAAPALILSTHDFQRRPADLQARIDAMTAATPCSVIKLAWQAQSLSDNIEAFRILLAARKPTIALCMGEFGLPSRVLAKKFGATLTFATLDSVSSTAPGQPTLEDLKHLYRWDALGPHTRVYGVIGYPVAHSLSPAIHNAGFTATRFDAVYLPLPIQPDYDPFRTVLSDWLALPQLHFRGASVTIPHKENLLWFVREQHGQIEPLAAQIGAANTLTVRDDGSLHASNTDYAAALDAVCDALGIPRDHLASLRVAVIGAGGVARAIVAGFTHHGATVVIYNRTFNKAQVLAAEFKDLPASPAGPPGKVVAARLEKLCDSCCHVYINCTPIGMYPHVDATPIPQATRPENWGPDTVVFDTIYNPRQTRLLREAHAAGCRTIPGVDMFIRQAAAQFALWTGQPAPLDVFRQAMEARLPK